MSATTPYSNKALEEINHLIRANIPYVWVNTSEEHRFLSLIHMEIADKQQKELWTWSSYQGLLRYPSETGQQRASGPMDKSWVPPVALEKILAHSNPRDCRGSIWVLRDFHTCLSQPIPRQMRDLFVSFQQQRKTVIIVSPFLAHGQNGEKMGIEPTLEKQIVVVDFDLPSHDDISDFIVASIGDLRSQFVNEAPKVRLDYAPHELESCVSALQGLTLIEVENAVRGSFIRKKQLDEHQLLEEKKQIIARSDILEYIGNVPSMDHVGGLDAAKTYLSTYANQFSKEAQDFGVEPLRGLLLTGLPGSGKSLICKAISAEWKLPLIKLDIGRVMGSLVGQSEARMRSAISQIEAISPCLVYVDEIEKSLSGTKSSGQTDGGTTSRVFGTLLTAMEEGMKNVVVIATANDIQALPPELIRRFNEVMFVDLPVPSEREEIFHIHLKKRGRDPKALGLDMAALVAATHLFTGSEIEKAVKESIARAFSLSLKDITQEVLVDSIKDTRCIARVMKEQINAIREWARDKARYASSLAAAAAGSGAQTVTTAQGKTLDLASDLEEMEEISTGQQGATQTKGRPRKQQANKMELDIEN